MSGKVDLLKTWEGTTTLLMWLWPVRMISRWKLTRWSWLGRYSFIDYFTVIITSRSLLRSRQEAAAGRWWSKPVGPRIAQILFLSGCWAAGIELSGYWAAGIELSSIFLFRLLNFNPVRILLRYFLPMLLVFRSRTVLSEYCTLSSRFLCPSRYLLYIFESSLNWLLGLAPSSLGLQELASQVGSINYPLALMVSPA